MLGTTNATPPVRQDARTPDWAVPGVQEFVPGRLDPSALVSIDVDTLPRRVHCHLFYVVSVSRNILADSFDHVASP